MIAGPGHDQGDGPLGSYEAFCRAARRYAGVDLEQYRRAQTERRMRALARRRGAADLMEYALMLKRSREERDIFRDRVTINVSQLWRNPEHWQFLGASVLPELARRHRLSRAWSAGCSYGAEPYTLAMLWREVVEDGRSISVVGTDIDDASIERARIGAFSGEDVRDVPLRVRDRWLDPAEEGWRVRPELRRDVSFRIADIFSDPGRARYDLVLCRNLVIYMTPERRNQVHRLLAGALRPGGYLMIGATERVSEPGSLSLRPVHPFIYRKDGEPVEPDL